MAGKILILALALSACKVQSQSIGYFSPSSNQAQSSCACGPSQPQTISGLKASPQLQFVPGKGCSLQAVPLSQLMSQSQGSQGSNLQKAQSAITVPKQNIQVSSLPQIPSSCAQYSQPSYTSCSQSSPSSHVISAPVSTITIPPAACTTIIDNSLSNSLANALQMMIANDFINSALSNNIINQDCLSIPVVETSVPTNDLSSFIKNLNANQLSGRESQTPIRYCELEDEGYDWGKLLSYSNEDRKKTSESEGNKEGYDWEKLLRYLNEDKKKTPEPEPENKVDVFFKYLKEKGKSAEQITKQSEVQYNPCVQSDDNEMIQAMVAYIGGNNCDTSFKGGNVAEIVFPEEIPAQLICNYGYMPTTVPVVSFSVQPLGDPNCNYIVGNPSCYSC